MAAEASTDLSPSASPKARRLAANSSRIAAQIGLFAPGYFGTGSVPTVIPGVASHFQLSISVVVSSTPSLES